MILGHVFFFRVVWGLGLLLVVFLSRKVCAVEDGVV